MSKKVKQRELYEQELDILLAFPELARKQHKWTKKQYKARVNELTELISASKLGSMKRRKGSTYERAIAKKFKEHLGIELTRTPQSGGFAKNSDKAEEFRGDIVCLDKDKKLTVHIECKDHKTWKPKDWYEQASSDCPKGLVPIVVMHQSQETQSKKRVRKAEDFVMIKLEDFLVLTKGKLIKKKEK